MANFPTLSVSPVYPLSPDGDLSDVIIRSEVQGGYELTRPRATRSRGIFGFNYFAMPVADYATLRSFESATLKNGADSFTWIHPVRKTTHTVRLTGPIKYANPDCNLFNASFEVKEV